MATSGNFLTNEYTGVGSQYPRRLIFEWGINSQSIPSNTTSIWWNVRGYGGSSGYWTRNFATRAWINGGQVLSAGTVDMYNGTVLGSGNATIGHNSNGTGSFSASADGRIYQNAVNVSGSGAWDLPTIPRYASINSWSRTDVRDTSFYNSVSVSDTCDTLQYRLNGGSWVSVGSGTFTSRAWTISGLNASTTYTVQLRVKRQDSQLWTESGVANVTTDLQNKFFDMIDW